jgi:hypothetical protein
LYIQPPPWQPFFFTVFPSSRLAACGKDRSPAADKRRWTQIENKALIGVHLRSSAANNEFFSPS